MRTDSGHRGWGESFRSAEAKIDELQAGIAKQFWDDAGEFATVMREQGNTRDAIDLTIPESGLADRTESAWVLVAMRAPIREPRTGLKRPALKYNICGIAVDEQGWTWMFEGDKQQVSPKGLLDYEEENVWLPINPDEISGWATAVGTVSVDDLVPKGAIDLGESDVTQQPIIQTVRERMTILANRANINIPGYGFASESFLRAERERARRKAEEEARRAREHEQARQRSRGQRQAWQGQQESSGSGARDAKAGEQKRTFTSLHENRITELIEQFPQVGERNIRTLYGVIIDSRDKGTSDARIRRRLIAKYHSDHVPQERRETYDEVMKIINVLYDRKDKSFRLY